MSKFYLLKLCLNVISLILINREKNSPLKFCELGKLFFYEEELHL